MGFIESVDVIETDEGRWDIQLRDSLTIIGCVWHTGAGFIAWDWADRQVGVFTTMPHAVGALSALEGAR
ncbi:hypothetical protein EV187_1990 [Agromyces ramosus]|jgi:hypothetical protein|uniref:Uncharacterized protein n=1 Tax=Agromyces ramosus TaxID=33879 RepID=A0A4Q7MID9_9MICO|nr:hypothetical protein [Agromyces ramosus]RZS66269.1 hypothetical protein EV187_1990 [Agromyces ramosus]